MILRRKLFAVLAAALILGASSASAQNASPFIPRGTSNIAVTGTAQALTLPSRADAPVAQEVMNQIVLTNIGTQTVFARWDDVTATVSNSMPLLANSQVVISVPLTTTALSVIAATTGSTLYATLGAGR